MGAPYSPERRRFVAGAAVVSESSVWECCAGTVMRRLEDVVGVHRNRERPNLICNSENEIDDAA